MGDCWPVLTIRQPWLWAIEHGKPVENRSRKMTYRGPLWLHAGVRARWDAAGAASPLVQKAWLDYLRSDPQSAIPLTSAAISLTRGNALMAFGAVAALAEVTGCHHSEECMLPVSAVPPGGRAGCSPWAVRDQWHIDLADVRPLPEPVPCQGMLGLWRLPEDVEKLVRAQLEVPWWPR